MVDIRSKYLTDFGSLTFDINNLPSAIGEKLQTFFINNLPIDHEIAELIALEMKRWAVSKGCTHYTHWFLPLTGLTAEKHNTFLQTSSFSKRSIIEEFSASELMQGEPDASSFPHGGIRSTFEARGYTVWDPSSPSFIIESNKSKTLFIPSIFISYTGEVLDKKTPLLRSIKTLSDICVKLLKLFGISTGYVSPLIGPEQEYFLIPKKYVKNRLDLNLLGYSIFGAKCPKGQKFQDHYFGSIKDNVLSFMHDTEELLIKLGIPIKTRHNEVAPNQFELAVLPEYSNIASDHNQLLMEILKRSASRYNLTALFHEKPFFGVNGSGKHINWSLVTDSDNNLFDISPEREDAVLSLLFISALIRGVHLYNDLLRSVFACSGNDRRLGGHEAPPDVISLYLGDELTSILKDIKSLAISNSSGLGSKKDTLIDGLKFLPYIKKDNTDRNRTSPIAFTGNKFEFRMAGASQSIAFPNTVINLIMADSLSFIHDKLIKSLKSSNDIYSLSLDIINDIYLKHKNIIYNGNTYATEWYKEAEKRNLFIAKSTPPALDAMVSKKNTELFTKFKILREPEIKARYIVKQNIYIDTIETEIRVARDMIRTNIIPAVFKYQKLLGDSYKSVSELSKTHIVNPQKDYINRISLKLSDLIKILKKLDNLNEEIKELDQQKKPYYYADEVSIIINNAQELISKLEERIDHELWPLSRYSDMFFSLS